MTIYRGPGGAVETTDSATVNTVTTKAAEAATSATNAASSASSAATSASSATNSASTATSQASAASTSATQAASSASAASTSASNASTSETNAATSATTAASSATAATTARTAAEAAQVAAETAETNAATSASSASTSASTATSAATTASTAATTATTKAAEASTSATNAATSETNAATSASSASTSATNASTSETNAATSASNASTSETNAATSETNAATSASSASTSATTATTKASEAATSASNASTSETNAATSASNASTSETNAANSATAAQTAQTNAETAETNAEAALDEFTDLYLGVKSSAPALDNDGDALQTGALYYDSTAEQLYIWDGSAWDQAAFSVSGAVTSFNTRTGAVTLSSGDVTTALGYTPYNSTNPNSYVVQSDIDTSIANLVDSAPTTLDTLNELAAALGDDANFSTTVTNSLATKAPLASPALTGTPTAPTATANTNTTQLATTAYVQGELANEANWNTAYGWGDHGVEGYLTDYTVTQGDVTQHQAALSITESQISDLGSYLTGNQTITLSGDVSGSGTTSISVTVADDSHNHVVGNIDNFTESVQDIAGAMFSGNTESGISAVYQDGDGTIDLNVNDPTISLTGAVTGSATMTNLGNVSIATTATADPTLTLTGDATGSATFTNLGNASLTVAVVNDSHTHDGRYFTETESDGRYVRTGANSSMSGTLDVNNTLYAYRGLGDTHVVTYSAATRTPDMSRYTNFVWTLTGNITLGNPGDEATGQSGVFVFIHSGAARTVSLSSDWETAGAAGLTLSGASGAVDIVPYFVQAGGNILLGTPQLAFS